MGKNRHLFLTPKAGLITEISSQTYESLEKQFREVISNALDAKATRVEITVKPSQAGSGKIIIMDDGEGMSEDDLVNEFLAVGGSGKKGQNDKIGRIGIGFLAIAVLAETMELETRKAGTSEIIKAKFDIGDFLDDDNHRKELNKLQFGRISSVDKAEDDDERHFTKITLKSVKPEAMEHFTNPDYYEELLWKLERILPVKYHDEHKFFQSLTAPMVDTLLKQNEKTINITLNTPIGGEGYQLVRTAYGQLPDENISGSGHGVNEVTLEDSSTNLTVFGYFLDAGEQLSSKWEGILVRVKNVAVDTNTFFEFSRDAAAMKRITGELYIEGLNEANVMTMNRSGFKKDHPDYIAIRKLVHQELTKFVRMVRNRSEIRSDVKKKIKEIKDLKSCFKQIGRTISDNDIDISVIENKEMKLAGFESIDFRKEIKDTNAEIKEVRPVAGIKDFDVKISADDYTQVIVSEDLLTPEFYLGGEEYTYSLRKGKNNAPPLEIDNTNREVRANIGHPAMNSRNPDVIKIVTLLEIAYANAKGNAKSLYDELMDLLEKSYN